MGTTASPETVSGDTVRTTTLLLPGKGKRADVPKLMPTKVTSKASPGGGKHSKGGKVVKINSAANSQAATYTKNKPTAMPTKGNFRSRTQPR